MKRNYARKGSLTINLQLIKITLGNNLDRKRFCYLYIIQYFKKGSRLH